MCVCVCSRCASSRWSRTRADDEVLFAVPSYIRAKPPFGFKKRKEKKTTIRRERSNFLINAPARGCNQSSKITFVGFSTTVGSISTNSTLIAVAFTAAAVKGSLVWINRTDGAARLERVLPFFFWRVRVQYDFSLCFLADCVSRTHYEFFLFTHDTVLSACRDVNPSTNKMQTIARRNRKKPAVRFDGPASGFRLFSRSSPEPGQRRLY